MRHKRTLRTKTGTRSGAAVAPFEVDVEELYPEVEFSMDDILEELPQEPFEDEEETEVIVGPDGEVTVRVSGKTPQKTAEQGGIRSFNEDWREAFRTPDIEVVENEVYTEGHDNPFAMPKNRRTPPVHTVLMECESEERAGALARSLVYAYDLRASHEGTSVRAEGVLSPVALMRDVAYWVESSEVEGMSADQLVERARELEVNPERSIREAGFRQTYRPGEKVAVVADFPDVGYLYEEYHPEIGTVIKTEGAPEAETLCESPRWGRFWAAPHEIEPALEVPDGFILRGGESG